MSLILCSIAALLPLPSTMVVLFLSTVIFLALPSITLVKSSSFMPLSSLMTVPPVSTAISSSMSFWSSPKPGAFTAHTFKAPRMMFNMMPACASPSTSFATISNDLPSFATFSSTGMTWFIVLMVLSVMRMYGSSNSHVSFSWSVAM